MLEEVVPRGSCWRAPQLELAALRPHEGTEGGVVERRRQRHLALMKEGRPAGALLRNLG